MNNANEDSLYHSQFMNTDRLAARTGGPIAFDDRESEGGVEPVEKGVANGWLNVRVRGCKWASAREFSRGDFDRGHQGRIVDTTPPTESEQPSYADPVADGLDPMWPESLENQF